MSSNIKLIVLDRDGVLNKNSNDKNSRFYYILNENDIELLEGAKEGIDILKQKNIPIVLATKQKCLSKGLISQDQLKLVNQKLQEQLGFKFDSIYIEPKEDLKTNIFKQIIQDYNVNPNDAILIDDSIEQCNAAKELGIQFICSTNLFEAVKNYF